MGAPRTRGQNPHPNPSPQRKGYGVYALITVPRDKYRMARVIAFVIARPLIDPTELVRGSLVIGCALALILAGPFLPSGL